MQYWLKILSYGLLAPISTISEFLLIWCFFRVSMLRKHPGMLIYWQCIFQTILDLHWFSGIPGVNSAIQGFPCKLIGAVAASCFYICWNYNLALSYEIYQKIRKPYIVSYYSRRVIYHVLSLGLAIPVFLILILDNREGDSIMGTCLVEKNSWYEFIFFPPLVVHLPLCLAVVTYSLKVLWKRKLENHILFHAYVVLAYTLSWGPIAITHIISYPSGDVPSGLLGFVVIVGGSSGFFIFLARILEPNLLSRMKEALICNKNRTNYRLIVRSQTSFAEARQSLVTESSSPGSGYNTLFDSLNTEVIVNMLIGLSYLFENRKLPNNLRNRDENFKWDFEVEVDRVVNFTLVEYSGLGFEELRKKEKVSNNELLSAFNIEQNLSGLEERNINPGGRGNAFFYYTANSHFIVKTLTDKELKRFIKLLPKYFSRVLDSDNSLIARAFGVFSIKVDYHSPYNIMLVENVFANCKNPLIFDLKGSKIDRRSTSTFYKTYTEMPKSRVYKDIDFRINIQSLNLSPFQCEEIVKSLYYDTLILEEVEIMDYSLLIGIVQTKEHKHFHSVKKYKFASEGKTYYLALIDYLQKYDTMKKVENKFKSMKNRMSSENLSSIPPKPYRERFLSFVKEVIEPCAYENFTVSIESE